MADTALAFQDLEDVEYPASDGEPMAETDDHRDELADIVFTLKRWFRDREDVYVSGNLFVYYQEGDPHKRRAPDVFVAFGVAKKQRRTYRIWDEGKAPAVVIELTSKETKSDDLKKKPELYARLGVEYLFNYDVLGDYLKPSLQGHRLGTDGSYHPLAAPPRGPFPCPPLGLNLILDENGRLQFVDRETGEQLVRDQDAVDHHQAARERAEKALAESERQKREMQAEIDRLRALLTDR